MSELASLWRGVRFVRAYYRQAFRTSVRTRPSFLTGVAVAAAIGAPMALLILCLQAWRFWTIFYTLHPAHPELLVGRYCTLLFGLRFCLALAGERTGERTPLSDMLKSMPIHPGAAVGAALLGNWLGGWWLSAYAMVPAALFLARGHAFWLGFVPALVTVAALMLMAAWLAMFAAASLSRLVGESRWREFCLAGTAGASLALLYSAVSTTLQPSLGTAWLIEPGRLVSWVCVEAAGGHPLSAWVGASALLAGATALCGLGLYAIDAIWLRSTQSGFRSRAVRGSAKGGAKRPVSPGVNLARREWVRLVRFPRYWLQGLPGVVIIASGYGVLRRYPDIVLLAVLPYAIGYICFSVASCIVGNEKECFWLTATLPLAPDEIVLGKFLAVAGAGFLLGLAAMLPAWLIATASALSIVASLLVLAAMAATAATFGLRAAASGANFQPSERDVDPEALATWLLAWHGILATAPIGWGLVAAVLTATHLLPRSLNPALVLVPLAWAVVLIPGMLRGAGGALVERLSRGN